MQHIGNVINIVVNPIFILKNLSVLIITSITLITFINLTCTIKLKYTLVVQGPLSHVKGQSVSSSCILNDRYILGTLRSRLSCTCTIYIEEPWVQDWVASVRYILRNTYSDIVLLRNIELYLYDTYWWSGLIQTKYYRSDKRVRERVVSAGYTLRIKKVIPGLIQNLLELGICYRLIRTQGI